MLEICSNSIHSALAAQEGGAHRIELCDNLSEGGTTPSRGTIGQCKSLLTIPVFVLIRPRGGDFVYSEAEFEVMKQDVLYCKQLGCEGIVTGILHSDGTVDRARTAELIALARPMAVTFHRAFDRSRDLLEALEAVISLGCERVLTSGGSVSVVTGLPIVQQLVSAAGNRIIVMPGAGLDENNIAELARKSGAKEFHGTAKVRRAAGEHFIPKSDLGIADSTDLVTETDVNKVRAMRIALLAGMDPAG